MKQLMELLLNMERIARTDYYYIQAISDTPMVAHGGTLARTITIYR